MRERKIASNRILVVDDEADVAELFKRRFRRELRRGDFDMSFARSAPEALDFLAETGAKDTILVVSDVAMPEMDGMELLEEIKGRWPHLSVVMVTAFDNMQTRQKAEALGATDFFAKPLDFEMLKAGLSEIAPRGTTI